MPNMPVYGLDCLFQKVIGVEGGHSISLHITVGCYEELYIMVLEKGPRQS